MPCYRRLLLHVLLLEAEFLPQKEMQGLTPSCLVMSSTAENSPYPTPGFNHSPTEFGPHPCCTDAPALSPRPNKRQPRSRADHEVVWADLEFICCSSLELVYKAKTKQL